MFFFLVMSQRYITLISIIVNHAILILKEFAVTSSGSAGSVTADVQKMTITGDPTAYIALSLDGISTGKSIGVLK